MIIDCVRPAESGFCRSDPAATMGDSKVDCTTSEGVALDIRSTHKAVIMMGPWTSETIETHCTTIDRSLSDPPQPDIPIDQLMRAVEGVRPYVKAHLVRFCLLQDVDDVLQDIRVAAWNGTVNGSYRELPGVRFDAWVQGIACNLCADHIRRNISKSALPLMEQGDSGFRRLTDMQMTRIDDQVTNQVWASEVLQFVKAHVPESTWARAVASLSGQTGGVSTSALEASSGMRWQAVFIVRQMALTVSHALDVDPEQLVDMAKLRETVISCLPNPLLQLIAQRVVIPSVLGDARAAVISRIANKAGVSGRYVHVQIGLVRNLVLAAEEILQTGAGIDGSVIKTKVSQKAPAGPKPSCSSK